MLPPATMVSTPGPVPSAAAPVAYEDFGKYGRPVASARRSELSPDTPVGIASWLKPWEAWVVVTSVAEAIARAATLPTFTVGAAAGARYLSMSANGVTPATGDGPQERP